MAAIKKGSGQSIIVQKDSLLAEGSRGQGALLEKLMTPLMDIYENEQSIIIEIDLPGVALEDISVTHHGDTVVVEGVKHRKKDEEKVNYLCMEISYSAFRRAIILHSPVNPHKAVATYNNGELRLTFPKIMNKRGTAVKIPVS
ncbi:MAG: Hsp20/alpha crystallin family protein [Nitrospirota bacterium]|nr:Hsp20/alpha crystallin family protein [Nitrospirota bacterium]